MDNRTNKAQTAAPQAAALVEQGLHTIKTQMPQTYAEIRAKAREIGNQAYGLVRRSLAGEPNCFYAVENGHAIGTPFAAIVTCDAAALMCCFGRGHLIIWPLPPESDIASEAT